MTKLKPGQSVTRVVDRRCVEADRDLVVTLDRSGIVFRAARRQCIHRLAWPEVLRKFDDLRKDLRA